MNEVTPKISLQEKVSARIKEQIGELIEPDDLKKLVDTAMKEAFFSKVVERDSYGHVRSEHPSLVVKMVKDLMQKPVQEEIEAWLKTHPDEVAKAIESVVREGIVKVVISHFEQKTQSDLYSFGNMLSQRLVGKPL